MFDAPAWHGERDARVVDLPLRGIRLQRGGHRVDRHVDAMVGGQHLVTGLGDHHQAAIGGRHRRGSGRCEPAQISAAAAHAISRGAADR